MCALGCNVLRGRGDSHQATQTQTRISADLLCQGGNTGWRDTGLAGLVSDVNLDTDLQGAGAFRTLVIEAARGAAPEGVGGSFWRGAWTVVVATVMQIVVVGLWLWRTEPTVFAQMGPNARIATFIGCTSAVGSIGWYTAFAMQNASYVRAVGQIEVVFTLLIAWFYFK